MNLRFHFVKDLLRNIITLEYVKIKNIIADILTKSVNEDKLLHTMENITLIS